MKLAVIGCHEDWALRAREAGLEVFALAAGGCEPTRLDRAGVQRLESWAALREALEPPRIHLLDLPPGATFDRVLDEGSQQMEPGDLLLDPGRSWWCDTLHRWRRLRHRALYYLDLARLRGRGGARMLVGGEEDGITLALPLLRVLCGGEVAVAGGPGAAHYLAMLGDAVATAVREAHSEAVQLAEAWPGRLDLELVRALWDYGEGGEGREAWVLDDALRLEAAVPLLAQAVMLRLAERLDEHRSEPPPVRRGSFVTPEQLE